jgi:CHAD domain-containing protein
VRASRPLAKLQDLLGEHQDAQVIQDWLRGIVQGQDRRIPVTLGFIAGVLAERSRRRAAKLRRAFPRRYERALAAKRWKELRRSMAALQASATLSAVEPS